MWGAGLCKSRRNGRPASPLLQALPSSLSLYLSSSSFRKTLSSFQVALAVSELPQRMGAQRRAFSSETQGWGRQGTPGFPQAAGAGPQLKADFSALGSKGLDPAGERRPTRNAGEFQGSLAQLRGEGPQQFWGTLRRALLCGG